MFSACLQISSFHTYFCVSPLKYYCFLSFGAWFKHQVYFEIRIEHQTSSYQKLFCSWILMGDFVINKWWMNLILNFSHQWISMISAVVCFILYSAMWIATHPGQHKMPGIVLDWSNIYNLSFELYNLNTYDSLADMCKFSKLSSMDYCYIW